MSTICLECYTIMHRGLSSVYIDIRRCHMRQFSIYIHWNNCHFYHSRFIWLSEIGYFVIFALHNINYPIILLFHTTFTYKTTFKLTLQIILRILEKIPFTKLHKFLMIFLHLFHINIEHPFHEFFFLTELQMLTSWNFNWVLFIMIRLRRNKYKLAI